MASPNHTDDDIWIREQISRIDSLLADTHKKQRAEHHLRLWQVAAIMTGGAAALLGAGAALMKLAGG